MTGAHTKKADFLRVPLTVFQTEGNPSRLSADSDCVTEICAALAAPCRKEDSVRTGMLTLSHKGTHSRGACSMPPFVFFFCLPLFLSFFFRPRVMSVTPTIVEANSATDRYQVSEVLLRFVVIFDSSMSH